MSQNTLLPDDPKLTAYALGELEGEELAAVEAALRADPATRETIEGIRATATQLSAALATEAVPEVKFVPLSAGTPRGVSAMAGAEGGVGKRKTMPSASRGKKWIQFPQLYYLVGIGAAACFAVIVALDHPKPHPAPERKEYTVIDLTPLPPSQPIKVELPAAVTSANPTAVNVPAEETAAVVVANEPMPMADKTSLSTPPTPSAPVKLDSTIVFTEPTNSQPTTAPTLTPLLPTELPKQIEPFANTLAPTENKMAEMAPAKASDPKAQPSNFTGVLGGVAPGEITGGIVGLSPYTVGSARDQGYSAATTLSGTRLNSRLEDISGSIENVAPGYFGGRLLPIRPSGARGGSNTEAYAFTADNDFLGALENPLSTFSIDVDTAAYANVRRFLQNGRLPPRDAVRIEELLNYFSYDYPQPGAKDEKPFAASLEVASAPWAPDHRLVRIGLKGREVATADRPVANLVFLLDVSGSMNEPNKLPLVKESMKLLVGKLRPDDHVAIVVYAGATGMALPSTPVAKSREIVEAINELHASGSTNGARGIQLAYDIAKANFVKEGLNRVILCTDGDFNVGMTSEGELTRLVAEKAESGVFLTVLGFGMGNLKDSTLEKLADKGNGNYGYIDNRREAEKLLVEQATGTLMTIAKDVKIQVEFNPAKVGSYRLIGYENRLLKKEDFNNDKVDAGEIGAGHTVTALYEVVPTGTPRKTGETAPVVDELKYQRVPAPASRLEMAAAKPAAPSNELLTVKVRYKKPDGFMSRKLEFPLTDKGALFADASNDFKFAAAVAGFGMVLRDSPHKGTTTLGDIINWAGTSTNHDPSGRRGEFIGIVQQAQAQLR